MPDSTSFQEPSSPPGEGSTAATNRTAAELAAVVAAAEGFASSQRSVDGWSSPAVRMKFLQLDALLQELVDATYDVDSVRASFTVVVAGEIVGGPLSKEYHRRG